MTMMMTTKRMNNLISLWNHSYEVHSIITKVGTVYLILFIIGLSLKNSRIIQARAGKR